MKKFFLFLFLAFFQLGFAKPNLVLVSLPPYLYFVEKIAQDTVNIKTLVPANCDPHIFEPSPKEVGALKEIDIWFCIGEPFENKLQSLLNKDITIVDLKKGISLTENDRHIWLSLNLAKIQAKTIADALIQKFPQHKELYQKNLLTFLQELEALDIELKTKLSTLNGKSILTTHSALAYFCKDFGLTQLVIETNGGDPHFKKLDSLLKNSKNENVITVLGQVQHCNNIAKILAKELDKPYFEIDPYSSDYINNFRKIALILDAHESH